MTYTSDGSSAETHSIELKTYYAGLGGNASASYDPSGGAKKQAAGSTVACYPNPFNPVAHISMNNPELLKGGIDIYNILGQVVASLVDNYQDAGWYDITWNGKDDNGQNVASGIYLYQMKAGNFVSAKKMVVLK